MFGWLVAATAFLYGDNDSPRHRISVREYKNYVNGIVEDMVYRIDKDSPLLKSL